MPRDVFQGDDDGWLEDGHLVNEKCIRRLIRLMGLMPIYQRPNISRPAKGHKTNPYLLKGLRVDRSNQLWCSDKQVATAAFALVFEKHCAGEVA